MEDSTKRTVAYLIFVAFFMMIIGPIASVEVWLVGLIVAVVLVPMALILVMSQQRRKVELHADQLEGRGLTEVEWKEDFDPDDFEDEID